MAKATFPKTIKSEPSVVSADQIEIAYIDYVLNNGQRPPSVFKFSRELRIQEDDFYKHFGSFEGLERRIWKNFLASTLVRLQTDDAYPSYSIREKLLAFYYTFFEDLRSKRSFILIQMESQLRLELPPGFLRDFRTAYQAWIENLLTAGRETGEIANRPYLEKTYPRMFWLQMAFLLRFWVKDNSPAFEQTDAAVEKSVNLSFDLITKGAVDTAFDFAKFMVQTVK